MVILASVRTYAYNSLDLEFIRKLVKRGAGHCQSNPIQILPLLFLLLEEQFVNDFCFELQLYQFVGRLARLAKLEKLERLLVLLRRLSLLLVKLPPMVIPPPVKLLLAVGTPKFSRQLQGKKVGVLTTICGLSLQN